MRGAAEIARSLFTLPTHRFVARSDLAALSAWIKSRSLTFRRTDRLGSATTTRQKSLL